MLSALSCAAQDWMGSVRPALGKQGQVRMKSGARRPGVLADVTSDELGLKTQQGEEVIPRPDIRAVLAPSRSRRAAHGAIAGAIAGGAFSGLVIGIGVTHGGGDTLSPGILTGIAVGVTMFASGIGAAIGAALPGSFKNIWRSP